MVAPRSCHREYPGYSGHNSRCEAHPDADLALSNLMINRQAVTGDTDKTM